MSSQTNNPPAAPPRAPQYQVVAITLSDGRRAAFVGPVLARPMEVKLLDLQVAGCVLSEPGPLPPPAAIPLLVACLNDWREALAAFQANPKETKTLTAAEEALLDALDGAISAAAPQEGGKPDESHQKENRT